jgi:hypothetical protein
MYFDGSTDHALRQRISFFRGLVKFIHAFHPIAS